MFWLNAERRRVRQLDIEVGSMVNLFKLGRTTERVAIALGITLAVVGLYWIFRFGSITRLSAFLSGERVMIEQPQIDLGLVGPLANVTGKIKIANLDGRPVKILGVKSACSCINFADLPLTISGGSEGSVSFELKSDDGNGGRELALPITLYTDSDLNPILKCTVKYCANASSL